jgi:Sec-independent protein secretion pathway component TatC
MVAEAKLAAVLTPTQYAFNQVLMAGPLCLLYELGILAARIFRRRRYRPPDMSHA